MLLSRITDADRGRMQADIHDPNAYVFYRYVPSRAGAGLFLGLFVIITVLHTWRTVRTRTWYFIPLVIGGVFEFVGYIGRIIGYKERYALGPYIIESLLLLLAPALFAASIYMVMGRIVRLLKAERYSVIPVRWLTKLFVTADVINFLLQGAGGGVQSKSTLEAVHLGEKMIIAGLFVQVIFFGIFLVVVAIFDVRIRKKPTPKSLDPSCRWRRHVTSLYLTSTLIFVRSIVRVTEYIQGNAGYIISHEVFLFVFDALPMLGVMVLYYFVHPSDIDLQNAKKEKASSENGSSEVTTEKVGTNDVSPANIESV